MANADSWLISGASGRLGYQLCDYLARRGARVVALRHNQPIDIAGVTELGVDLIDHAEVAKAIAAAGCTYIVHTAGLTNVDACEAHPDDARRIHVDATRLIAAAAKAAGARLIHISTDHLWKGTSPNVTEEDPPAPINVYARTKYEGEIAALAEQPETLILRTNFFGRGRPRQPSFSDWIDRGLRCGDSLKMFTDVFFSPIAMELLCPIIDEMAQRGAAGIFHAAGRDRLSKYDFGILYAEIFGYGREKVVPASVADATLAAPRPSDMSLSTAKIEALLGRPMPSCRKSLLALKKACQSQTMDAD